MYMEPQVGGLKGRVRPEEFTTKERNLPCILKGKRRTTLYLYLARGPRTSSSRG